MTAGPLVSIIVLNWNGKRYIDPFMDSVKNLQLGNMTIEVLFTDNASSDDSVEYYKAKYENGSTFRLVQNDANYGYSKGNNLGMQQAKGELILVCNNDLTLDANLLIELYETMERASADLVTPKLMLLNRPGYINNAGSRLDPNSTWPVYDIGLDEKDKGQYEDEREISAFCGACVLFKRSFLETVGVYDDKFFMYFEDSDLSWRGQKAKKKFYYAPKAIAYHHHAGSSKEWSPLFTHFVFRNRMLVLTKNAGPRIILAGWKITAKDHFVNKMINVSRALRGTYSKKAAIVEFYRGQKLIWAAVALTPYVLLKRFNVVKERRL